MVLQSRREYLDAIRKRYRKAGRKDKSVILGEFCATCGYNRKQELVGSGLQVVKLGSNS